MDAASWISIGSTIVLLSTISTGFRSLRGEMQQLRQHFDKRIDAQSEQIGQLREWMAKLEGLLEGLREAISGRRPA